MFVALGDSSGCREQGRRCAGDAAPGAGAGLRPPRGPAGRWALPAQPGILLGNAQLLPEG